jgi:hypothetical protein
MLQLQGARTFCRPMSRKEQQSKHTRKSEEGPQYDHLFQVQAEGTLLE